VDVALEGRQTATPLLKVSVNFWRGILGTFGVLLGFLAVFRGIFGFCWGFAKDAQRCPSEVPVKPKGA
jgi:hypothetical protein